MSPQRIFEFISTLLFCLAVIHTFLAGRLQKLAENFKKGSVLENFFHLFGEIEIVFGFWSAILILAGIVVLDFHTINSYLSSRNFTEPMFVFVIMAVCSTRPIVKFAEKMLIEFSYLLPIEPAISVYFTLLFITPLLGSFITEPAAMTIAAFLLLPRYFTASHSLHFKYATMAALFLNISIGGTLTPFAAPPVLMVAKIWNWDLSFMMTHFAPKTILATLINTLIMIYMFKNEILKNKDIDFKKEKRKLPFLVVLIHLIFLVMIVLVSHYPVLFFGLFLFLIGFMHATNEFQGPLSLKEPLLVAFFLSGIVVLGGTQEWWLIPFISSLSKLQLYLGSIGLTAFTDNAALTYLGSLVPGLETETKLALVQGSVIGGGLTIIANAPNPAGFGILKDAFGEGAFSPLKLVMWSIPLTILTAIIFWL